MTINAHRLKARHTALHGDVVKIGLDRRGVAPEGSPLDYKNVRAVCGLRFRGRVAGADCERG